jgi:hypothetical protein
LIENLCSTTPVVAEDVELFLETFDDRNSSIFTDFCFDIFTGSSGTCFEVFDPIACFLFLVEQLTDFDMLRQVVDLSVCVRDRRSDFFDFVEVFRCRVADDQLRIQLVDFFIVLFRNFRDIF